LSSAEPATQQVLSSAFIRTTRQLLGANLTTVAREAGLAPSTLSRIETGRIALNADTAKRIRLALARIGRQ
jgi:transcriptional regulator with XRE-family HTH domain